MRNITQQKATQSALLNAERLSIQGEIARTFAHELRNPLASIRMATDVIHHQWLPDITSFENWGISPDTRALYENMGHKVRFITNQGQAMGIYIDAEERLLFGSADSRSYDSRALGY